VVVPRRILAAAGILACTATCSAAAAAHPFPRFGSGCARADFVSHGTHVRAERCGPPSGPRAVIVLHGCGGFSTFDHRLAAGLPSFGIATLYVDYFAPTPPPGTRGYCGFFTRGSDVFAAWERVAADAAADLRRHYRRVGAVGGSLGAGVAIATAESLHPFDAVAAFSALAFPPTVAAANQLPPTIFLDGGAHDSVAPENAQVLYEAARAAGVYANGSHDWPGAQGDAGRARAAAFLLRHL